MKKLLVATAIALAGLALPAAHAQDAKKPAPPAAAAPKAEALLDINTATEAQLVALPGIGDKRAKDIIKHRPYARKDEIKSKAGISDAVYAQIQDKIIAKQK